MSEFTPASDVYTTGYHGTSLASAERIIAHGFEPDQEVWFFPINKTRTVRTIGRFAALAAGDTEYVLIEADFPPSPLTEGLEDDHIVIEGDAVDRIEIKNVTAWQSRMNAGIPPRQLYPVDTINFAERWQ